MKNDLFFSFSGYFQNQTVQSRLFSNYEREFLNVNIPIIARRKLIFQNKEATLSWEG